MRVTFTYDQRRLEGTVALFRELPARMQRQALPPALLAGARVLRKALQAAAPRRTGRLRKGILRARAHKTRRGARPPQTERAAYVLAVTPYTTFVERDQPFFVSTVQATAPEAERAIAARFEAQVIRLAERLIAKYGTR